MSRSYLLVFILLTISGFSKLIAQSCVPLSISCPSDVTITADPGACGEVFDYVVSVNGDCPLQSMVQTDGTGLTSGSEFPIGTTLQSWMSTDSMGNTSSCDFLLTILEFPNPITDDACNANINLSPDMDCEVLVTADMVLEGGPYGCYDNYIVTLTTQSGTPIPNPITADYIGQTIIASVQDPSGNSCWGFIHYEDYIITPLQCGSYDVNCRNETEPSTDPLDSIPFPIPSGFVITPAQGVGPFVVQDYDNCGDIQLSYTDNIIEIDCSLGGPYTRTIYRTWTATDNQANTTTCVDTINLRIPTLSNSNFFPNRNGTDAPSILCSGNWDANNDGIPQPDEIGDVLNMNCDLWGSYSDIIHELTCGVIIDREWEIVNMCTGEFITFFQQIRLEDDEAPEINCEPELFGSTNLYDCEATYHVPHPYIDDGCSSVSYTVSSTDGDVLNIGTTENPHYIISNLPIGSHTLTFTAIDGCGNQSSCTSELIIEDLVPPLINCENNLTIHLGAGQDYVDVDDLLVFVSDPCGVNSAQLRRVVQGSCDGTSVDDLQWHDVETFCCEEAGQSILIEVGVWDVHGNLSTCIASVLVESNVAPSLTCPPDITVSCSFVFDLNDLSIFGSVVDNIDDVEDIYIDDQDYIEHCKGQTYNGPKKWGHDGLVLSDCPFSISEEYSINTVCGRSVFENGTYLPAITREFIISNEGGVITSCVQNIFIVDCNSQASEIIWPPDVVIDACVGGSIDPDYTGIPELVPGACDELWSAYQDEDAPVNGDTCRHILRHWYVISRCPMSSDSFLGEYDQNIYIIKSDEIQLINCIDSISNEGDSLCLLNPNNGCEISIDIPTPDVIDCDSSTVLSWEIDFDFNNNTGFISDESGAGMLPDYFPFGQHVIRWIASDMCGNTATCETIVELIDCEPPLAMCDEIEIQVFQDSTGITVFTEDIAGNSMDNCGDVDALFLICEEVSFETLLYGHIDSNLIIIDTNTAEVIKITKIKNMRGRQLGRLQYINSAGAFFTILNGHPSLPERPSLAKIDMEGNLVVVGELRYELDTAEIFFTEGEHYVRELDKLIIGGSTINGGNRSQTLFSIDYTTGFVLETYDFSHKSGVDFDHLSWVDGKLFASDHVQNIGMIFSSVDLTVPDPTLQFEFSVDDRIISDFAVCDNMLFAREERELIKIDPINETIVRVGSLPTETEFNGNLVNGMSFVKIPNDSCLLTNSLVMTCDDINNYMDTVEYTIVVFDAAGNTDTCSGTFVVSDSNETCTEEQCEFIYTINTGGDFTAINTTTGEFQLVVSTGVTTGTNAVAVNAEMGIGYFGSLQTVYWVNLEDGTFGIVGNIGVPGSLSAAAASFWNGHLYLGPETANQIDDIFRVPIGADGKSFDGPLVNLTNGSVPTGNFGDFVVLEGGLDNERMLMSIYNNINANNILEYNTNTNTFTVLSVIPSGSSSQITIDNVGNIWYYDNATNMLGFLDPNTGVVSGQNNVPLTITDLGRSYCPQSMSSIYDYQAENIKLFQNRPNPFTEETYIDFYLERNADVRLIIWSVEGRVLHESKIEGYQGLNSVRFSNAIPPGVYTYQIISGQSIGTNQMIKVE